MTVSEDQKDQSLNQILKERYEREWAILARRTRPICPQGEEPTNPLILDVPTSYADADVKLMIFGQETNDWEGPFPCEGGVDHLLETYVDFYSNGNCYAYGGHFWNGVKAATIALTEKVGASNKRVGLIWNNLIKVGKAGQRGVPPQPILDWQADWFNVVSFELSLLKPDVTIFFTGPRYDSFLERIFSGATFQALGQRAVRQLARVHAPGLPSNSIRTYHPNYLWRNGFREYIREIVRSINL